MEVGGMTTPIKVIAVTEGDMMRSPRMREFISRCYSHENSDVDPEALCDFLAIELESREEWLKLFIAIDEESGPCGMSLVVVSIDPLSPNPWISHFVAEKRAAFSELADATKGYLRDRGFRKVSVLNRTGASDRAHARMCRRWGGGAPAGSLIVYELEG
jgi:hypothetical protein